MQAPPPAPLSRRTHLVLAPAVVYRTRRLGALYCARRRSDVTRCNGTIWLTACRNDTIHKTESRPTYHIATSTEEDRAMAIGNMRVKSGGDRTCSFRRQAGRQKHTHTHTSRYSAPSLRAEQRFWRRQGSCMTGLDSTGSASLSVSVSLSATLV